MGRPKMYKLPKGLTYDKATNRYRYTDPMTGKRYYITGTKERALNVVKTINDMARRYHTPEVQEKIHQIKERTRIDAEKKIEAARREHERIMERISALPPGSIIRSYGAGNRPHIMRQQTPPWADKQKIRHVYDEARALTEAGHPHHVDHVFPLQGKYVSGLHCEDNLAVVPAYKNWSKYNNYFPT